CLNLCHVTVEHGVGNGYGELLVLGRCNDRLHFHVTAEPLLERRLHRELRGRRHLRTVGREGKLEEAAAEVRKVHALARRGKQYLLDKLPDVLLEGRLARPASSIELVRKVDVHSFFLHSYVAVTLGCPATGTSGVPVGAQIELRP